MSVMQRLAAGAVMTIVWACVGPMAIASTDYQWDEKVKIREGSTNYTVYVGPLAAGELVLYANGEDCGSANHKTFEGERRFMHWHVNYDLDHGAYVGINPNTGYHLVTQQKIDDYWDWVYGASYSITSAAQQHRWNCFTYAFFGGGTGTFWIQDKTRIIEDDWEEVEDLEDNLLDVMTKHVIKIHDVDEAGDFIKQTSEKCAQSDIYWRSYPYSGSPPNPQGTLYRRDYD